MPRILILFTFLLAAFLVTKCNLYNLLHGPPKPPLGLKAYHVRAFTHTKWDDLNNSIYDWLHGDGWKWCIVWGLILVVGTWLVLRAAAGFARGFGCSRQKAIISASVAGSFKPRSCRPRTNHRLRLINRETSFCVQIRPGGCVNIPRPIA